MEKPKHKPEQMLMAAIGFTEDDLESNRQGVITAGQKARFNREYRKRAFSQLPCLALFACFTAMFLSAGLVSGQLGLGVVLLLLIIGFIVYQLRRREQGVTDMRGGDVQNIEGRVQLDATNMGNTQRFIVSVLDQTFNVKKEIFLAFKNGDPYIIYYVPHSKTILSAEWLREGD